MNGPNFVLINSVALLRKFETSFIKSANGFLSNFHIRHYCSANWKLMSIMIL